MSSASVSVLSQRASSGMGGISWTSQGLASHLDTINLSAIKDIMTDIRRSFSHDIFVKTLGTGGSASKKEERIALVVRLYGIQENAGHTAAVGKMKEIIHEHSAKPENRLRIPYYSSPSTPISSAVRPAPLVTGERHSYDLRMKSEDDRPFFSPSPLFNSSSCQLHSQDDTLFTQKPVAPPPRPGTGYTYTTATSPLLMPYWNYFIRHGLKTVHDGSAILMDYNASGALAKVETSIRPSLFRDEILALEGADGASRWLFKGLQPRLPIAQLVKEVHAIGFPSSTSGPSEIPNRHYYFKSAVDVAVWEWLIENRVLESNAAVYASNLYEWVNEERKNLLWVRAPVHPLQFDIVREGVAEMSDKVRRLMDSGESQDPLASYSVAPVDFRWWS